jgi:hypothetical protein
VGFRQKKECSVSDGIIKDFRKRVFDIQDLFLACLFPTISAEGVKDSLDKKEIITYLKEGLGIHIAELLKYLMNIDITPRSQEYHKLTDTSLLIRGDENIFKESVEILNEFGKRIFASNEDPEFQEYDPLRYDWIQASWAQPGFEYSFYMNPSNDLWNPTSLSILQELSNKLGFPFELFVLFELLLFITKDEREKDNGWIILQSMEYLKAKMMSMLNLELLNRVISKVGLKYEFDIKKLCQINELQIKTFLESLVFTPEKDLHKCPLFPVRVANCPMYIVWNPMGGFITSIFGREFYHRAGHLTSKYGLSFDVYFREWLKNIGGFFVNLDEIKINRKEYESSNAVIWSKLDELKGGTVKEFQIDGLAWNLHYAYIISCKTRNFVEDVFRLIDFGFCSVKEFRRRLSRNAEDLEEVYLWSMILQDSSKFKEKYGLRSKTFIPLVITPRKEPLQIESIRKWYETNNGHLPEVRIIDYITYIMESIQPKRLVATSNILDSLLDYIGESKESKKISIEHWVLAQKIKSMVPFVKYHARTDWFTVSMIPIEKCEELNIHKITEDALILRVNLRTNRIVKILSYSQHGERAINIHKFLFERNEIKVQLLEIVSNAPNLEELFNESYDFLATLPQEIFVNPEDGIDYSLFYLIESQFRSLGRFDLVEKFQTLRNSKLPNREISSNT